MSDEAERALIGCVLNGAHMDELQTMIKPEDFANTMLETIFGAAVRLSTSGEPVDPVTIRHALGSGVRLPGGPLFLFELMESAPNPMNAPSYARIVKDEALDRRLDVMGTATKQLATSGLSPAEKLDRAHALIDGVADTTPVDIGRSPDDLIREVLDLSHNGAARPLSTGWPSLDKVIGGLAPGRLIVVGSRPGIGKSIMGGNLALHMARHHQHAVVQCSMEMSQLECMQRHVASHTNTDLSLLDRGELGEVTWAKTSAGVEGIMGLPLRIVDGTQTVTSIRLAIRNYKKIRPDVALVVVDYLQLMGVRDRNINRHEQIGEISRGLKEIANDYGVCVVAMSQLNRESIHRTSGKPNMADLRESGSIEADADIVILLNRTEEAPRTVEVMIEKNRSGRTGYTTLEFQGDSARMSEFQRGYAPVVYESSIPD